MANINRRNLLKLTGLTAIAPWVSSAAARVQKITIDPPVVETVTFNDDGPSYDPAAYLAKLEQINQANTITRDFYGKGGAVDKLAKQFATATGKEAAIYMPTGTMANQLAIAVLSGDNTKVFVQETSHIFRDEADAAQSVFRKRLIPLAKGEPYFTLEQLKQGLDYYDQEEVFKSGIGTIAIENPVRRSDGRLFPMEEIKKISAFARTKGYTLHLDGARLYLASAYSGISVAEYASYFDTLYISLYKYLGAGGGAILCGDNTVIGRMEHLVKVHGGTVFNSWTNAAMALHHLDGLDKRLQRTVQQADELFAQLNKLPGIEITKLDGGTNISDMKLGSAIDIPQFRKALFTTHQILTRGTATRVIKIQVNETLLRRDNAAIVNAFKDALATATK
jgi:threonine aldolase